MNTELHFSSKSDSWETPKELFDRLNKEFCFELDVCANFKNSKCLHFIDKKSNGLKVDWKKRIEVISRYCLSGYRNTFWMNPPYGKPVNPCKPKCKKKGCAKRGYHVTKYIPGIIDWVKKARDEASKGSTVVCLLPGRIDTEWYHKYIWDAEIQRPYPGVEVRIIKGRLKFVGAEHSAPFPSMIVIFRGG